jgi:hypothetical protein
MLEIDSSCIQRKSKTAITVVVTVRSGDVYIDGDGRRLSGLEFRKLVKIEQRREERGPVIISELLYVARTRLITKWSKERSPARGEDGHGVVLSGMRAGEVEDDPLPSIFR